MSTTDVISYTSTDFKTARSNMITLAKKNFPSWTDFFESNNGIVFIELFAHVLDLLTFYQNQQANECFIDTVRIRKNLVSLSKLIGYELKSSTAAIALVDFSSSTALTNSLIIQGNNRETRTQLRTPSGITFEVLADSTFQQGTTSIKNILVKNVITKTLTTNPSGLSRFRITLPVSPFLDDKSVSVEIDTVLWKEVITFVDSTSTSKDYIVSLTDDDKGEITFGDGVNGVIPGVLSTVKVIYEVGGGIVGNVAPANITDIVSNLTDSVGASITLSVTNPLPSIGGTEKESLDDARVNAPASLRTLNRSISSDDFETNALLVSGVGRAKALTRTSIEVQDVIGIGDAAITTFTSNLLSIPIKVSSILIRSDTVIGVDDGLGNITGTGITSGTINYLSGSISITFSVPPSLGTSITVDYTRDKSPTIFPNFIFLYIVPTVGGVAPISMLGSVKTSVTVTKPSMVTTRIIVTSAKFKSLDASVTVNMIEGSNPTTVRSNIDTELTAFFNPITKTNKTFDRSFGESIHPSQLLCAIQKAPGVLGVTMETLDGIDLVANPKTVIVLNIEQLIAQGDISITLIDFVGHIVSDFNINYDARV